MADHSFKSAKDRRLGSLLHYQQPNLPQTHPLTFLKLYYYSEFYAELKGRLFTCYAPVRYDLIFKTFNLHVLRIPIAFILSQDQTLLNIIINL